MSVNFDAKLTLDISEFMRNIKTAENSVQKLENQIAQINKKSVKAEVNVGTNQSSSMQARRAAAAETLEIGEKLSRQEANNAKVEWQAEGMRQKAMDARLKDHETLSSSIDRQISKEKAARTAASDSIRQQMVDREKMNKVHAQALAMNEKFNAAQSRGSMNLARERYALYDVAAAYQEIATAAVGSLTAVIGTAAEYERAFANVIRTTDFVSIKTGEAARIMRFELMQLAAEIPVAFGQISEIATIGNQLGIAQRDLTNFTETVAKFATTTDVTVNNAALSFGRIGELLDVSDFNALGSAIAFAGVNAVATETQILSVTKEIATTAKQAKFTAPEVVGLATALSSLGIAPEAARGSIIRSFAAINKAISEGGQDLQNYANISGMSADQFASTWQQSGSRAFDALLKGLQASSDSGANLDTTLRSLGIRNVRDIQTLQKLGDNYDVYAQSIRDANSAYAEGTFLSESYAVVQETVAAKFQVIQNQINNLFAGLGESTTGPLKALLDVISVLIEELTKLARNPAIQAVAVFATAALALVAAIAALNAVASLASASILAFTTAMTNSAAGANAAAAGVNKFAFAAKLAIGTLLRFTAAMGLFVAASVGIGVIGDEIQKLVAPMDFARRKAEEMLGGFVGLQDAITQDTNALNQNAKAAGMTAEQYAKANGIILVHTDAVEGDNEAIAEAKRVREGLTSILGDQETSINNVTGALEGQTIAIGANTQEWIKNSFREPLQEILTRNKDLAKVLAEGGFNFDDAIGAAATGQIDTYFDNIVTKYQSTLNNLKAINPLDWGGLLGGFNTTNDINSIRDSLNGVFGAIQLVGLGGTEAGAAIGTAGDSAGELEENLDGAARALRTVVDYANDLSSILSRVTDLKFGKILGRDDIAEGFERIRESSLGAAEAIREANLEINDLNADRGTLQYQLSVAERYGDEKRAAKLRAEIAKIDEKIVKSEEKKAEATERASTALTGGSKAARENRAELLGVVSSYEDYIATLARLGRKPSELAGDIQVLKKQFREQALALGFNESELSSYLDLFDNFGQVAQNAPRDVDIEVKLGIPAAEQAITEFTAKNRSTNVGVNAKLETAKADVESFASKQWRLTNVVADRVKTDQAEAGLQAWLNKGRTLSASLKFDSKQMVLDNAAAALRVARAFPVNSTMYNSYIEMYRELLKASRSFASGGYVSGPGTGTSDSIRANLSNGEFVMKASAVKTYGVDFMNSINQQKFAGPMPVSVSSGNSAGTTVAFLSPEDRALLRAVADRPVELYADSRKIAQTANDGNALIARRGVR